MDNLLDSFVAFCRRDCKEKMSNVDVRTLRDKMKMTDAGPTIDGPPKALVNAIIR